MTIKQQGGIFGRNPTFNNVDVEGDLSASAAQVDNVNIDGNTLHTTTGNLNIYADAPSNVILGNVIGRTLTFDDNTSNLMILSAERTLELRSNGGYQARLNATTSFGSVALQVNSDTKLSVANDSNVTLTKGNLVIGTSGKGIDFSATSGTGTSELFDDYEEGTWTPLFTDGTNNATMSAFNAGFYTKVGNLVTISGYIEASSLGSMSGDVKLAGLPFTTAGTGGAHAGSAAGWGNNLNITAGQVVGMITDLGTTTIGLKLWDASTGATNLQASEMLSNTVITINLTYRAA